MKNLLWIACTAPLIAGLLAFSSAADAPPLVAQPPLLLPRAPGRFDYLAVDDRLHRLLIAHTGSRTFDVVSMANGDVVRQIDLGEAHGIAVDIKHGKYFVGTSRQPGLNDVNRKNLVLNNHIAIPGPIDAVAFDTKNNTVYADRADTGQVMMLDGKTDKLTGAISIGGDLEYLDYDPVTDRIYQNEVKPPAVAVIDPAKNAVVATWSAAPASDVTGLAIDSAGHRVLSAGSNGKLVMLDSASGAVVASTDIAPEVDQITFDPGNHRVYCASGTGQLSVVQETTSSLELLANITVPRRTHSVAVDPSTHAVWIAYGTAENDYIMKLVVPPASPAPAASKT